MKTKAVLHTETEADSWKGFTGEELYKENFDPSIYELDWFEKYNEKFMCNVKSRIANINGHKCEAIMFDDATVYDFQEGLGWRSHMGTELDKQWLESVLNGEIKMTKQL